MNEKTTEQKIREHIWLHADEPLRKIQAGILEDYGESKSLQWISKERQAYLAADKEDLPLPQEPRSEDLEIAELTTKVRKLELEKEVEVRKKELLLAKADVEVVEDLREKLEDAESRKRLLTRKLEEVLQDAENWVNATCPKCKGKFLLTVFSNRARCVVCGKYYTVED